MPAAVEYSYETGPAQCDREVQADRIARLINVGGKETALGKDAEATCTYYSIFQPELCDDPAIGLRRLAPIELYEKADRKLRAVASRYAAQLIDRGCYLPGESASGIVGVPRGALNLYLISNQYDVFAEFALHYAAEEFGRRDIKRFLMSSVRARLGHLESVQGCGILLEEEQEAFSKLAGFEARLQAHLAPLQAKAGRYAHPRFKRPGSLDTLSYA